MANTIIPAETFRNMVAVTFWNAMAKAGHYPEIPEEMAENIIATGKFDPEAIRALSEDKGA